MDSYTELAKEIHKRNNKKQIDICVGEAVSLAPLIMRVYYNGTPVEFDEVFSVKGVITGNMGAEESSDAESPATVGDKFIRMAGNDNQSLYVLGKFENMKKVDS